MLLFLGSGLRHAHRRTEGSLALGVRDAPPHHEMWHACRDLLPHAALESTGSGWPSHLKSVVCRVCCCSLLTVPSSSSLASCCHPPLTFLVPFLLPCFTQGPSFVPSDFASALFFWFCSPVVCIDHTFTPLAPFRLCWASNRHCRLCGSTESSLGSSA